ncbi:MAG: hypothetical protein QFB86_04265 [Patescibacteria group bacterium]|nr:hypothetical protein [Patescibacteria group bacterium]
MDSAKKQLADKLKTANNVLVTVSRNPSVDQLAALLGLSLALNKTGKHAAAVFSGEVPSTLEFLQPEVTFQKNTDSLRDFIIALDKAKADKLRYKVEDDVVRIFITPYKTSISDADLEFSQGDFNVDVVVAIGVQQQEDLDEAITAHGRILHDATVTSINVLNGQSEGLGSINWHDDSASSLCELVGELVQLMDKKLFDEQIATALLTGIVAETERFSNEKTTSQTMSMSATLMAAGANQQLVATKLAEPVFEPESGVEEPKESDKTEDAEESPESPKSDDGTIEIMHDREEEARDAISDALKEIETTDEEPVLPAIELPEPEADEDSESDSAENDSENGSLTQDNLSSGSRMIIDPPTLGGQLTANNVPEALDPSVDPLSMATEHDGPLLSRSDESPMEPIEDQAEPEEKQEEDHKAEHKTDEQPEAPESEVKPDGAPVLSPPPADWNPPEPEAPSAPEPAIQFSANPEPAPVEVPVPSPATTEGEVAPTLADLEAAVASAVEGDTPTVNDARDEVSRALNSDTADQPLAPITALNAQPLGDALHPLEVPQPPEVQGPVASSSGYTSVEELLNGNSDAPAPSAEPFVPPVSGPSVPLPDDVVTQQTPAEPLNTAGQSPIVIDANAPPPVPPPIPFQFGVPPSNSGNQQQ